MNKALKKLISVALVMIMMLSLAATACALKESDEKSKDHPEFGTLFGGNFYEGPVTYGYKTIFYGTTITKLSSTSINTRLYAMIEVRDYLSGEYYAEDHAPVITNDLTTAGTWISVDSPADYRLISSFGAHEARRSGSAVVYTEIYGF